MVKTSVKLLTKRILNLCDCFDTDESAVSAWWICSGSTPHTSGFKNPRCRQPKCQTQGYNMGIYQLFDGIAVSFMDSLSVQSFAVPKINVKNEDFICYKHTSVYK